MVVSYVSGEGKYHAKTELEIAGEVAKAYGDYGDLDKAVTLVATSRNRPKSIILHVYQSYKDQAQRQKEMLINRKEDWITDVVELLKTDTSLLLLDACKQVMEASIGTDRQLVVASPQRMANLIGIYVAQGHDLGIKLNSRLQSPIRDNKQYTGVSKADHKKMMNDYTYYVNMGTRDKQALLSKLSQAFKGKYAKEVIEDFVSKLPKWDMVK